jgi:hypothetical protein
MSGPYQIALGFPAQCRQKGAVTLSWPTFRPIHVALALLLGLMAAMLIAQIEGERGIPPIASSGDYEVADIKVDVYGPNADVARASGWKLAQRLAWRSLWQRTHGGAAPGLGDAVLDGLVSAIEVQREQIGPNRYIATLSVLFDRARAGQALGVSGQIMRSPPLLVIPVLTQSGVSTVFERPTEWQKAWAVFRTGDSAIDYVRTTGSGADPLLLNAGQTHRRGRNWWRALLDQYGAADVIMPLARLEQQWPGGPVVGQFAARYGPDNRFIGSFTLRAGRPEDVPTMLADAVKKIDQLYVNALMTGVLRPDPSLIVEEPLEADALSNAASLGNAIDALPVEDAVTLGGGATAFTLQADTPDGASLTQIEAVLRGIPGTSGVGVSSLALGGTSIFQMTYRDSTEALRAALDSRGFDVAISGTTLRIARRGAAGNTAGN